MATLSQRITELAIAIRGKVNLIMPRLLPEGGIDGQVLTKNGLEPFASEWRNAGGVASQGDVNSVRYHWDFLATATAADAWLGAAVSGGNNTGTAPTGTASMNGNSHPGVLALRSGTTVNSGYRYLTGNLRSYSNSEFSCVSAASEYATAVNVMGFLNSSDSSEASNGIYFKLTGTTLDAVCKASNISTVVSMGVIDQFTFYHYKIVISLNEATFSVTNDSGLTIAIAIIDTNVPFDTNVQCGIIAWDTAGGSATHVMYPDYLRLQLKNLGRG